MPFVEDVSELLLPTPVYLVAFVFCFCVYAFRRTETNVGRIRYVLAALFIWSYLLTVPAIANMLISHLERKYPLPDVSAGDGPELIVVLSGGRGQGDGTETQIGLDKDSWERTYTGVRLWKQIGGKLLFVGGADADRGISVAESMANVASSLGVPKIAILVETKSRDTHQNLVLSRDLILQFGNRGWLVTSALHLPRAMAVAEKLGLRLRAYPCDYKAIRSMSWAAWLPNNVGPTMFTEGLHEFIGLGYYRFLGYAK
jgi:uncharacterized SAM-binding protein YcdF (DUF218 family)